jgi:hypothetical protein
MAAKFILKKSGDQYMWNLVAANGQNVLRSEMYNAKASATNGIESVKDNAGNDARYDRRVAKDERPYFVLKAGNGEIIGTSQLYTDPGAVEAGIAAVKSCAPAAQTEEQMPG